MKKLIGILRLIVCLIVFFLFMSGGERETASPLEVEAQSQQKPRLIHVPSFITPEEEAAMEARYEAYKRGKLEFTFIWKEVSRQKSPLELLFPRLYPFRLTLILNQKRDEYGNLLIFIEERMMCPPEIRIWYGMIRIPLTTYEVTYQIRVLN